MDVSTNGTLACTCFPLGIVPAAQAFTLNAGSTSPAPTDIETAIFYPTCWIGLAEHPALKRGLSDRMSGNRAAWIR